MSAERAPGATTDDYCPLFTASLSSHRLNLRSAGGSVGCRFSIDSGRRGGAGSREMCRIEWNARGAYLHLNRRLITAT